jgi:hypothetical protein
MGVVYDIKEEEEKEIVYIYIPLSKYRMLVLLG